MPRAFGGGSNRFSIAMVSALAFQSEMTSARVGPADASNRAMTGRAIWKQDLVGCMIVSSRGSRGCKSPISRSADDQQVRFPNLLLWPVASWPCRTAPSNSECTRGQSNGSVMPDRQRRAKLCAQFHPPFLGERAAIGRCRALTAEKGGPVVLEGLEHRGYVDDAPFRRVEAGVSEQRQQCVRMADWKAAAFVEITCVGIEGDRGVPKMSNELHLAGVVPYVDRSGASRPQDAPHLGERLRGRRNEIEDQAGHDRIEQIVRERQCLCMSGLESGLRCVPARVGNEPSGWIDAGEAAGHSMGEARLCGCARPTG